MSAKRWATSAARPIAAEVPLVRRVPAWMDLARCLEVDSEIFFPEKGTSSKAAKKVCISCEVRTECLAFALAHHICFGVWGGKTEQERRKLKRQRQEAEAA